MQLLKISKVTADHATLSLGSDGGRRDDRDFLQSFQRKYGYVSGETAHKRFVTFAGYALSSPYATSFHLCIAPFHLRERKLSFK